MGSDSYLQFDLATLHSHYSAERFTMKKFYLVALLAIGVAHFAAAQGVAFGGLEKAMDPDTYERAGLGKLTSEERAALDHFVRDYIAAKQKAAADIDAAVERVVKERKLRPPELIKSKIVGRFNGYGPRTFFRLENGELWRPTNDYVVSYSPIESPNVIIYRDSFGYKMFVEGASTVRVKRVQ